MKCGCPISPVEMLCFRCKAKTQSVTELVTECEECKRLRRQIDDMMTPNPRWEAVRKALAELYEVYSKRPRLTYGEVDSKVAALMEAYDEWLD